MKNQNYILLLFITILVYHSGNAQDFLVTTKADTIYGEVKPLNYGAEKKVQIKGADKKKQVYSMFQVVFYSLNNEQFYPVKSPHGYSFMKLLKSGYLSLYAFQAENQMSYDNRYLLKRDGKGTEVPNLGFKKIMTNFLSDCDQVSTKIENGNLQKRDLEKIVDEYNACINSNTMERLPVSRSPTLKKTIDHWSVLAEKVRVHENFEGKENALEMINETKSKIIKGEKVPNFLIQGLKSAITPADLQEDLQNALNEINP